MTEVAQGDDVERRRIENATRLALRDLPLLRAIGLVFVSLGVFLNNRYVLGIHSLDSWWKASAALVIYAAASWIILIVVHRLWRRDGTVFFLAADVVMWTFAIYMSGAEESGLFFILLMRVADQTQTTFRRCQAFVVWVTLCYGGMIAWVSFIDRRPLDPSSAGVKVMFIVISGVYIALSARTAEARREQIRDAIRVSRGLIQQLEERSNDLREARARADEANAAKSEFLANMSHEMRTPLHGVIGMLQLARDGEVSPERARHIELAQRSAESLLSTIDDVLEFSKIEARKLQLEPVYFSVRELLRETMKPLGVTAAAKGLILSYSVAPAVPQSIWTDPLRLRQILTNLVGNAIKFTHAGEVAVRIWADPAGNGVVLRGEVTDTGIGIDPSVQRLIFDPFTQVDTSRTRRYTGTGLGLSIVSRLVEAMGGSVEVESERNRGSRFSFTVAAQSDGLSRPPARSWEGMVQRPIVIVDRHERERAAIAAALRSHGFKVEDYGWSDDVLHEDYACFITTEPRQRWSPVIVIASPLQQSSAALMVTRPVDERELIDAIGVALGYEQPRGAVRGSAPKAAKVALRVLVVEDNTVSQEFAMDALRRMGHEVTIASDGAEAIALVQKQRFDAVLMDVQMPGIDGLEATARIRALETGPRLPIIAMTAHTREEERQRCHEAGMDAVLTKPVDRHELAEILGDLAPPQKPPEKEEDGILAAVGGNAKLLARVTAAFLEQTPRLLLTIREAIDRADGDSLYHAGHKLKGSVANFPTEATEVAKRIEECGRTGDFGTARALLPRLETALRELENKLIAAAR